MIKTIFCSSENAENLSTKEVLVLLHGYGGSGCMFFPIIKKLAERFILVLVDIIGMAGSSRPHNFDIRNLKPQ